MRSFSSLVSAAVVAAVSTLSIAGVVSDPVGRVAILNGIQEVPAVNTTAFGSACFTIDTETNTLTYRISFTGLTGAEVAAHIHGPAAPGVNGPVAIGLPAGNPKVGTLIYPEGLENDLLNGRMYVNVHSAGFPGGEIRGQIMAMVARIDGFQEVPAVVTPALGVGLFNVRPATNELEYYIIYAGLSSAEVAAHIHGFSLHGVNSGVRHPLPAGAVKTGVWTYAQADEQRILDGMCYVNVHSANNPGGEIRGQIVSSVNPMDSQQETPPLNVQSASGIGLVAFDQANNTLSFDMFYAGLTSAAGAAHIHGFSAPGAASGVRFNIGVASQRTILSWIYTAANATNVLNGLTYFNVHTAANAGGEIRGQIKPGDILPDCVHILSEPQNLTVPGLQPASFSVVIHPDTPTPVSFQWRRNGVPIPALLPRYSGVTSPTLTINPVEFVDEGTFDCVITNPCGSVVSAGAVLDVTCDPIDFNGDGLFPSNDDLEDFLAVFGGGTCADPGVPCSTDIDFNNNGLFPENEDIEALFAAFGGAPCP